MSDAPIVWCLLGRKAGDNTQVRALAGALGWPWQEKHIFARPWELLAHLSLRVTLAGIDRSLSSELQAPWPDLVISAGRRNEPVARWIQRQSGGRTRLVHVGRPWAPLSCYDLIITTPQYFLPQQDNVLQLGLPLSSSSAADSAEAADQFEPTVRYMPRPRIALLVGGDSGKYVFTAEKARNLGRAARVFAESQGGSLMLVDSPRTPLAAGDVVQAQLREQDFCFRWGSGQDNPYQGILATADAFIVTGESMSMLAEAIATTKPLYIFDTGDGHLPWWQRWHLLRYKPLSHWLAMKLAPRRMRRDIGRIQDALIASGQAIWLQNSEQDYPVITLSSGEAKSAPSQADELQRAAAAVRQLLTAR